MKVGNYKRTSRQQRAAALLEQQADITPQQQLERLDQGGFVAKKERAKLARQLKK